MKLFIGLLIAIFVIPVLAVGEEAPEIANVIKERFDEAGNREWIVVGLSKQGNLWQKTDKDWEQEASRFGETTGKNLSLKGNGSIQGKFCWEINPNECKTAEWGDKYVGVPVVKLFPADPVILHNLSNLYNPTIKAQGSSIESVFTDYEKQGRLRNFVKESVCKQDGTFNFENVPPGEWVVYGYLECQGKVWTEEPIIPRHCEVWVLFAKVEQNNATEMKNFFFGTKFNGLIDCRMDY